MAANNIQLPQSLNGAAQSGTAGAREPVLSTIHVICGDIPGYADNDDPTEQELAAMEAWVLSYSAQVAYNILVISGMIPPTDATEIAVDANGNQTKTRAFLHNTDFSGIFSVIIEGVRMGLIFDEGQNVIHNHVDEAYNGIDAGDMAAMYSLSRKVDPQSGENMWVLSTPVTEICGVELPPEEAKARIANGSLMAIESKVTTGHLCSQGLRYDAMKSKMKSVVCEFFGTSIDDIGRDLIRGDTLGVMFYCVIKCLVLKHFAGRGCLNLADVTIARTKGGDAIEGTIPVIVSDEFEKRFLRMCPSSYAKIFFTYD
jgi:hypothetical protein